MYALPIRYDETMPRISRTFALAALSTLALLVAGLFIFEEPHPSANSGSGAGLPAVIASPFVYSFNAAGVLNEADSMQNSTSPYWWLNSGGELILQSGIGETMQGEAPLLNRWRILYALSNPLDTDGGTHPQNLFRLVSKSVWNNVSEEAHFFIVKDNFSTSPNRNQSNGLLLMSRYTGDGQTLYYAGVRVDGTAVIKKKIKGVYYTLAQKQIFPGTYAITAGTSTSQNLLPHGTWIGLKSETVTGSDGHVTVTLYMQNQNGTWVRILSAVDDGGTSVGHTTPIIGAQYSGVRTDFMDVELSNFRAQNIAI